MPMVLLLEGKLEVNQKFWFLQCIYLHRERIFKGHERPFLKLSWTQAQGFPINHLIKTIIMPLKKYIQLLALILCILEVH